MRKILLLIVLTLLLCNCSYHLYNNSVWHNIKVPDEIIKTINENNYNFNQGSEYISKWIKKNLKHVSMHHARPLQEILDSGYGDCVSRGLLLLAFTYNIYDAKGCLEIYNTTDGNTTHAVPVIFGYKFYTKIKGGKITNRINTYHFGYIQEFYYSIY